MTSTHQHPWFFCLTTNGCLNIITWHPTHLFFGQHIITCFLQEKSRNYVFFHCIGQRQKTCLGIVRRGCGVDPGAFTRLWWMTAVSPNDLSQHTQLPVILFLPQDQNRKFGDRNAFEIHPAKLQKWWGSHSTGQTKLGGNITTLYKRFTCCLRQQWES